MIDRTTIDNLRRLLDDVDAAEAELQHWIKRLDEAQANVTALTQRCAKAYDAVARATEQRNGTADPTSAAPADAAPTGPVTAAPAASDTTKPRRPRRKAADLPSGAIAQADAITADAEASEPLLDRVGPASDASVSAESVKQDAGEGLFPSFGTSAQEEGR